MPIAEGEGHRKVVLPFPTIRGSRTRRLEAEALTTNADPSHARTSRTRSERVQRPRRDRRRACNLDRRAARNRRTSRSRVERSLRVALSKRSRTTARRGGAHAAGALTSGTPRTIRARATCQRLRALVLDVQGPCACIARPRNEAIRRACVGVELESTCDPVGHTTGSSEPMPTRQEKVRRTTTAVLTTNQGTKQWD